MHPVATRCPAPRAPVTAVVVTLVLLTLAASCSLRRGVVATGTFPPPDGAQMTEAFLGGLTAERRSRPLPPVPRDRSLDEIAAKGLQVIEAGLPDGVSAAEHVSNVARLPAGFEYGVGFEENTPGLDERTREAGGRGSGSINEVLLAWDPALDAYGWAAAGPWSVIVFRSRTLAPGDAQLLQAALEKVVGATRNSLRMDPQLASIAAEAVADGLLDSDDDARYGRAGGVPVEVSHLRSGAHLASSLLSWTLRRDGSDSLIAPWLATVGIASKITESGTVLFVILATGEADRPALTAELAAAEPRATELVNQARAEAALPAVRLDGALVDAARQWLVEASRRGCYVGFESDPGCPGPDPKGADWWTARQSTWSGGERAFTWYLAPAQFGDDTYTRFGAAATLAPNGTVWSMLVLAV